MPSMDDRKANEKKKEEKEDALGVGKDETANGRKKRKRRRVMRAL